MLKKNTKQIYARKMKKESFPPPPPPQKISPLSLPIVFRAKKNLDSTFLFLHLAPTYLCSTLPVLRGKEYLIFNSALDNIFALSEPRYFKCNFDQHKHAQKKILRYLFTSFFFSSLQPTYITIKHTHDVYFYSRMDLYLNLYNPYQFSDQGHVKRSKKWH